jgi:hypothetical protein
MGAQDHRGDGTKTEGKHSTKMRLDTLSYPGATDSSLLQPLSGEASAVVVPSFILKVIILPRQARDKHTKKAGFSQIRVDGESFTCPASGCPIGTNFLTGAKANYTPHRVSQVDTTDRVDRLCTPSGAGIRACAVLDINGST